MQTTETKLRKKISTDVLKTADMAVGDSVEGTFLGFSEREWTDKETGQIKPIPQFLFEKADKSRFNLMGDAGLKSTILNAGIKEGDNIQIVKLEMVDLGGGKRVNQYEIYQ